MIDLQGSYLRLIVTDDKLSIGRYVLSLVSPVYSRLAESVHAVHLEYSLCQINPKRCYHYHSRFLQVREFRYTVTLGLQ